MGRAAERSETPQGSVRDSQDPSFHPVIVTNQEIPTYASGRERRTLHRLRLLYHSRSIFLAQSTKYGEAHLTRDLARLHAVRAFQRLAVPWLAVPQSVSPSPESRTEEPRTHFVCTHAAHSGQSPAVLCSKYAKLPSNPRVSPPKYLMRNLFGPQDTTKLVYA